MRWRLRLSGVRRQIGACGMGQFTGRYRFTDAEEQCAVADLNVSPQSGSEIFFERALAEYRELTENF
jgi:hypothetical protein